MIKNFVKKLRGFSFLSGLLVLIFLNSCVSHEELLNFTEGTEFEVLAQDSMNIPQLKIQVDDILMVRVFSQDPEAVVPFNIGQTITENGDVLIDKDVDYLVDKEGNISFPVLGNIAVAGLTTIEARESIAQKLIPHVKDPIVSLRLKNFKISVIGEVKRPQTFIVEDEEITILQALSEVGDFTNYANRKNVLVIRESNGIQQFGRLNLHSRDIFRSPFFYLQQNDVVYVEPIQERTASISDQSNKILPWASIVITMATLVVTVARN